MNIEHQKESNWCWAAVAASIHNFLHPTGGLTQGAVATRLLEQANRIPAGVDCATTPDLCNYTARLDSALSLNGDLGVPGFLPGQYLVFDSVKNWVNRNRPIGARIVWESGGAHFIVVDGYREFDNGDQQVHVQDPLYGPSFQFYEDLVADYSPGGSWQDTYLVPDGAGTAHGTGTEA